MYGMSRGPDGKAPPTLYPVGKQWGYSYMPPGSLTAENRLFPTYQAALCAAIAVYCSYNTRWRLQNKARTYRQAAALLGIPTEPPSKAEALKQLRQQRFNYKNQVGYMPRF